MKRAGFPKRILLAASLTSNQDHDGLFDIYATGTGVYVWLTDTGSDPFVADIDGDGFNDGWEVARRSGPNDPNETPFQVPVPALDGRGQALLLLPVLVGSAARRLTPRRRST